MQIQSWKWKFKVGKSNIELKKANFNMKKDFKLEKEIEIVNFEVKKKSWKMIKFEGK